MVWTLPGYIPRDYGWRPVKGPYIRPQPNSEYEENKFAMRAELRALRARVAQLEKNLEAHRKYHIQMEDFMCAGLEATTWTPPPAQDIKEVFVGKYQVRYWRADEDKVEKAADQGEYNVLMLIMTEMLVEVFDTDEDPANAVDIASLRMVDLMTILRGVFNDYMVPGSWLDLERPRREPGIRSAKVYPENSEV